MSDKQNDRQWPADLIALKWAETLSEGEQSVLLTRSLKQLQAEINAALNAERERAAKIAETAYEQFQTGYNAGKYIAGKIREGKG